MHFHCNLFTSIKHGNEVAPILRHPNAQDFLIGIFIFIPTMETSRPRTNLTTREEDVY